MTTAGSYEIFIDCSPSWAFPAASRVCLLNRNTNCSTETILYKILFILLAITFVFYNKIVD